MPVFSLNLNKIALLRNWRGSDEPNVSDFARKAITAGVRSLTVHPREDAPHIRLDDVVRLARLPELASGAVELNIEGDLRAELITLVETLRPSKCTVVPVTPGEVTSDHSWRAYDPHAEPRRTVERLAGLRVAVFCDATNESCDYAVAAGARVIELYTGPFAKAFKTGTHAAEVKALCKTAEHVRRLGLRVNAGHDLTLENLAALRASVEIDEVSIGHQVTIDAVVRGWAAAPTAYMQACR
ncbi:MAG: pyridoxine 5'-phosphate synthase [Alphaproteobacteria bacterium]|nr:pyridoxine 5'-phosphate synthase [Alphaproteobacteria bacterium]